MTPRDDRGGWVRRILFWNVYVGQHPTKVRAALIVLALRFWPHYIALQEAKRFNGSIPGYTRHAADHSGRDDADNCVILVRKGLDVSGMVLPVDNPAGWVHNRPKPPRTFYATRERHPRLTVVDVHRCTRGLSDNRPEWEAEDQALDLFGSQVAGPLALVGDWNMDASRLHRLAPAGLAERVGGVVVTEDEDRIDYAIVRGCAATVRRIRGKHGSDHHPNLLTLRKS